ncbi:MAG: hypothetical protein H6868_09375 [Rhodospirillales bacterium]|nr:hypothetical protein [Rhodospirillales bacterium]
MSKPSGDNGLSVRLYNIKNSLTRKLGIRPGWTKDMPGHVDEALVKEADALIAERCERCPEAIGHFLEKLTGAWVNMRDLPDTPEREELSQVVFMTAHEIKDIAAMCGYDLAAYFAESLRDYIDQTELNLEAQRVIIQAHVDALSVVHKQGLKADGGPAADELKKMVKVAIEKYR